MVSPLLEDYEQLEVPTNRFHAVVGALLGDDLLEQFEVYRRRRDDSQNNTSNTKDGHHPLLFLNVTIGRCLTGHEGIVHGGIITLLFDEATGWGYDLIREAEGSSMRGVTANLNVHFRHPIKVGTPCRIWVYCKSSKGRKYQLEARMESCLDGGSNNTTTRTTSTVYADATSLYIAISSRL
jgi:acyl-coenzyme A thioesterase PaaI-like protein